jgi:hypothetical protein
MHVFYRLSSVKAGASALVAPQPFDEGGFRFPNSAVASAMSKNTSN